MWIHRSRSSGAARAEYAWGAEGVTEGGGALERQVEVGQAEKLGLDPMSDRRVRAPCVFQKGPPGAPREA